LAFRWGKQTVHVAFYGDIIKTILLQRSISAGFFDIFSTEIGTSINTNYNWGSVSSATQGQSTTVTIVAVAPAGYKLLIQQVIGSCGGNIPRTDSFKTSHIKSGRETKVTYEGEGFRHMRNMEQSGY
jgi:hypothetical protein